MLDTDQAADILFKRRTNRVLGPRLPEACRPGSCEDALRIQTTVSELMLAQGIKIGAWKCLLPVDGKPNLAPIYRNSIFSQAPVPVLPLEDLAAIEPEFAFVFKRALPPRDTPYSRIDIGEAVGEIRLAFELIRSRYLNTRECEYPELLADCLLNQGLYLGPIVETSQADLDLFYTTSRGTDKISGHHPNGDPELPLEWLVNYLRESGTGIEAGQAVITGSIAGILRANFEEDIALRYGELGETRTRFFNVETPR